MILEEEIKRLTDYAEYERTHGNLQGCLDFRQLAEWLEELKEDKSIIDIMSQFLADVGLITCCTELMTDETEQSICEATCNNSSKECWIRWAKMKAREVNADENKT